MIVGVIGSGSIGPDLAYAFLSALAAGEGGKVYLLDIKKEALDAGVSRIEGYIGKALSRGRMSQKAAEATRSALVPTMEIKDLANCDYDLEAATEEIKTKKIILRNLENVVKPDCLIGFATSAIPRAHIAAEALPGSDNHRCASALAVATPALMIRAQTYLVVPVNFRLVLLGFCADRRIFLCEPAPHRRGVALVGGPHRFLRRQAPMAQIPSRRPHRHAQTEGPHQQLPHRLSRPCSPALVLAPPFSSAHPGRVAHPAAAARASRACRFASRAAVANRNHCRKNQCLQSRLRALVFLESCDFLSQSSLWILKG